MFINEACAVSKPNSLGLRSRVQPLRAMEHTKLWLKRDDELSFGISGTKWRKYASLLPALESAAIEHVIAIGGARSNNLLAAAQLLRERGIDLSVVALGEAPKPLSVLGSNQRLLSMILGDDDFHWVARDDWGNAEAIADQLCDSLNKAGTSTIVLPEGAAHEFALPGAMSLALDIVRNEVAMGEKFEHIFLDAGTGFSAQATILAAAVLENTWEFHVLLLAQSEDEFQSSLQKMRIMAEKIVGGKIRHVPVVHLYEPSTARSFGATNRAVFEQIKQVAKTHGVLLDPIYSAKLWRCGFEYIQTHQPTANCLLLHSGGALSLLGFDAI